MYTHSFTAMTVPCQLLLAGKTEPQLAVAANQVEHNTKRLESKYNFYREDSWLNAQINQRQLSSLALDTETSKVLTQVRALSEATQGCFDITIGTLKQHAKRQPELNHQQLFDACQGIMGLDSWQISGNILSFAHPQTQLDLGGVIKEYAVDQAYILCRQQGIESGLINFGGDIISWGVKPDGQNYRVALANPLQRGKVLCTLPIQDQALATSGHSERSVVFNQQSHSHILAKAGVEKRILSTSVISNSVLTSGIYSTALSIRPELTQPRHIATLFIDESLAIHRDAHGIVGAST